MLQNINGFEGSTRTSRYWDCCKPSCAWPASVRDPTSHVKSCTASGRFGWPPDVKSGCDGGTAFMCNSLQPWIVNDYLAYGFTSASFADTKNNSKCCTCYRLDFEGSLSGKVMIVQVVDTGSHLGYNEFNLAIPGGGTGYFYQGCIDQWGLTADTWGDQYDGVNSAKECLSLPKTLQKGCEFRFTFMEGISNPGATFKQIVCPSELVALSGCDTKTENSFYDQIIIKK